MVIENEKVLYELLKDKPYGVSIKIDKSDLPWVKDRCRETILGCCKGGARTQYRCKYNIHILEYKDYYMAHRDEFDPYENPVMHLVDDMPGTIVVGAFGVVVATIVGVYSIDKAKEDGEEHPIMFGIALGSLAFLLTATGLCYLGDIYTGWLRNLMEQRQR